jgi:hypothetical protein
MWRMIGSIGHAIIQRINHPNTFQEERLKIRLHGWDITGKVDLIRQDDAGLNYGIDDFKFRSVWAAKDLKPEDEKQLNLYSIIAAHNGFNITQLRILNVLRDWSKLRASREPSYPQVGEAVREIPLWSPEEQEAFLGLRVRAHQQAEELADDDLPMCTEEERWHKPDIWAVKKPGGKRAVPGGLHKSIESARAFAATIPAHGPIEYRPGEDTRCLHYCAVKNFCSYGKTLGQPLNGEEAAA